MAGGGFQKKSASFFVTVLIGLIVVSFVFTGYERMGSGSVASVGGMDIELREFEGEYRRLAAFYGRLMGGGEGRALTRAQMERMDVRGAALRNLVRRKLLLIAGGEMGLVTGPEEIRRAVRSLPGLSEERGFDVERYKAALRYEGTTPAAFEDAVAEDRLAMRVQSFLAAHPVSSRYADDVRGFRSRAASADVVSVPKGGLWRFVAVPDAEIDEWLASEANALRTRSLFNDRKESLAGDGEGEPAFEDHRRELARELVQRTKSEESARVLEDVRDRARAALGRRGRRGRERALRRLSERYGLVLDLGAEVNLYDGSKGSVPLDRDQTAALVAAAAAAGRGGVQAFDEASRVVLAAARPLGRGDGGGDGPEGSEGAKGEGPGDGRAPLALAFGDLLSRTVLSRLEERVSVQVSPRLSRR